MGPFTLGAGRQSRYILPPSVTDELDIEELARRQLDAYDAHRPSGMFEQGFVLTVAEAYALQFRVAALREERGETVAGYKVGRVSEAVRRQLV